MNSKDFCQLVLEKVHHATQEEKASIRQELLNHLEDHADVLKESGYSQEDADERALSAMGQPEEIGIELNKQYPLGWLVLSRAALMLSILLGIVIVITLPLVGHVFESLQARIDPFHSNFCSSVEKGDGSTAYSLDIKVPIGNDILSIYKVALQESRQSETGYAVSIAMCNYDRNPFGIASQSLLNNLTAKTAAGIDDCLGGGGGGNSGAYYWVIRSLPVAQTETELYLCYDRFGEHMRVAVPLNWEVLE